MSEWINNRAKGLLDHSKAVSQLDKEKQEKLKQVMDALHAGKTVDDVKAKFAEVIDGISAVEISALESALVEDGLPVEEIQRLCDVHAEVFKDALDETETPDQTPGHPIHTFMEENRALEELIRSSMQPALKRFILEDSDEHRFTLLDDLNAFADVEKHYVRKENLVFPFLEHNGVVTPPKVMWGVHDEIRAKRKELKQALIDYSAEADKEAIFAQAEALIHQAEEMIYKEEKILFPLCLETLTEDEWIKIYDGSDEIGYTLVTPEVAWVPKRSAVTTDDTADGAATDPKHIALDTGVLSAKEINLLLNHLPGDMTYVNKDDLVKYFSSGKERIFPRTKAIIGRSVDNCHPPKSAHIVTQLVQDFKDGKKDTESFWLQIADKFIHIQYFAIRDENGEYQGVLEYSQDIAPLRALEGEKRLVSEDQ